MFETHPATSTHFLSMLQVLYSKSGNLDLQGCSPCGVPIVGFRPTLPMIGNKPLWGFKYSKNLRFSMKGVLIMHQYIGSLTMFMFAHLMCSLAEDLWLRGSACHLRYGGSETIECDGEDHVLALGLHLWSSCRALVANLPE